MAEKKKSGRLHPDDENVWLALSTEEKAKARHVVADLGLRSLSLYARWAVVEMTRLADRNPDEYRAAAQKYQDKLLKRGVTGPADSAT